MKEITFINKTAKSKEVSRSTPEERKRINERNREYRSHQRHAPFKNNHSRSQIAVKVESLEGLTSSQPDGLFTTTDYLPVVEITSDETPAIEPAQLVCPLTGITIGNLGDPFNTFAVPLTSENWRVIQFYKDVYYKRLWTAVTAVLGTVLKSLDFTRCHPDEVIQECLLIPSRMYSLLASASCNLQHNSTRRDKSLLLIDSGTASLRSDLQNSRLDRHSLLTSIHLHLAASSLRQNKAAEAHLSGARAILHELLTRGVLMPPATIGMVALVDGELAIRLLEEETTEKSDVGRISVA